LPLRSRWKIFTVYNRDGVVVQTVGEREGGRRMKIALWIMAICEVVRAVQNAVQLRAIKRDTGARDNAYAEFVKSLKMSDRQFVERMLKEFERQEGEG
jgi:hypothetical protein